MSRGRAYPILKRSSQIVLVLSEINPTVKQEKKQPEKNGEVKAKKEIKKTAEVKILPTGRQAKKKTTKKTKKV